MDDKHFKRKDLIKRIEKIKNEENSSDKKKYIQKTEYSMLHKIVKQDSIFIRCTNCSEIGHTHKKCPSPILSYGIISAKREEGEDIKFLLIQRKNSIGFVDFIKFKYNPNNIIFLGKLFTDMVPYEKNDLLMYSFEDLYKKSFAIHYRCINHKDFENSKQQFLKIKHGYVVDGKIISIESLICDNPSYRNELEWGFPKGKRRRGTEEDLQCAIREFDEETNYKSCDYTMINFPKKSLWELYKGTNDFYYMYVYYAAFLKKAKPAYIDPKNICQIGEIGNITWVTYEQAKNKLDDHHPERIKLLSIYRDFITTHSSRFKTIPYQYEKDSRFKNWNEIPYDYGYDTMRTYKL